MAQLELCLPCPSELWGFPRELRAQAQRQLHTTLPGASALPSHTSWMLSGNELSPSSRTSNLELLCRFPTALHHFYGVLPFPLVPALC